jgi:chromosome segregation ATPase
MKMPKEIRNAKRMIDFMVSEHQRKKIRLTKTFEEFQDLQKDLQNTKGELYILQQAISYINDDITEANQIIIEANEEITDVNTENMEDILVTIAQNGDIKELIESIKDERSEENLSSTIIKEQQHIKESLKELQTTNLDIVKLKDEIVALQTTIDQYLTH